MELWTPQRALGGNVKGRPIFVTAETAAVCPTTEQALANECGNSVETVEEGLRFKRGEQVEVVGDEPVGGLWRAIRPTKMGRLPSWVDPKRVAPEPDLSHVKAFRENHPNAVTVTSDQLRVAIQQPTHNPDTKVPLEPTVFLTRLDGTETALVTGECFGVKDEHFLPFAWSHHGCLTYADCDVLDYICSDDGYCDEIVFALEDREPFEVQGKMIPAKTVTALADRVDVFADIEDCQR